MRLQRLGFVFFTVFVVFIGGSSYYNAFLPVRVFTHAVLTAALLGWLIVRIRRGAFIPATPLNWPVVAGAAVLALSAAFSVNPRMAIEQAWWPLVHGLIFFFLAAEIAEGRQRRLFETQFLLGALTVIFAGLQLLSWWFGWGLTPNTTAGVATAVDFGALLAGRGEFPPVAPMIYLPLGVSTWLAAYTAPQIMLALAWARTARRRDERIALWGLAGALAVILAATGSRGGLLALATAIIVFLLLRLAPGAWKSLRAGRGNWRQILLPVGAVLLVGVAALGLVLYIGRSGARTGGDELRGNLWRSATEIAQDYPILGVGPGQFGRTARAYRQPGDYVDDRLGTAHNILLNTAAEEGIDGVLVLGAMAAMLLVGWYRQRRTAGGIQAVRLDAVLAALAGFAVQSLFDTFTVTAIMVLLALLAAYAVVPPVVAAPRKLEKAAAWGAAVLVAAYGLFWIPVNLAHGAFEQSVRDGDRAAAERAASLDPGLHLYPLQIAYLMGVQSETSPALLDDAIAGYESALALEPTWDTGWINLAGLYERAGRIDDALAALDRANAINALSAARWNWARIADEHDAAPDAGIIAAYVDAMGKTFTPFSPAWLATPRRAQAAEQVFAGANPRLRYALAEALFPERRESLVPANPATADEWWVVGQHALTVLNDPQAAFDAFSEAVRVNPNREIGEYYAARARAAAALGDATQARRDAAMAALLVNNYIERPSLALLMAGEAEGLTGAALHDLRANAVPGQIVDQNFEGVLFGRVADFRLAPALRPPGPGPAVFAPWYAIAADYEAAGEWDRAANVYRVILDAAPDETLAAERLAAVEGR